MLLSKEGIRRLSSEGGLSGVYPLRTEGSILLANKILVLLRYLSCDVLNTWMPSPKRFVYCLQR